MIKQSEIGSGGVYRLTIGGELVAEFVPGDHWSEISWLLNEHYHKVESSWEPFEKSADTVELPTKVVTGLLNAAAEVEKHTPMDFETIAEFRFIVCSCDELVKPTHWTRHMVGGTGSSDDLTALESVAAHYLV